MSVWWETALVAVTGALGATALRRPIFALAVDSGEPDRTHCAHCDELPMGRIPAWTGKCANCGGSVGPRWGSVEIAAALVCAAVVSGLGFRVDSLGVAGVFVIGVALSVIDLRSFRLPDRLIVLGMTLLAGCLITQSVIGNEWSRLLPAAAGAASLSAAYLLLAVIRPGQLGLGDVKLAGLLGMLLGWFGWPFVVLGGCLAFLLSALIILLLLAARRITLRSHIPFGPFMLAGAAAAVLL